MSGLGLNNGGEFTPHVRWQASTSTWAKSSEGGMEPFTFTQAIVDLENIQTGWGYFAQGEAPEWVLDQGAGQRAAVPDDRKDAEGRSVWKRGFKVNLFSNDLFGEDSVREFATTTTGACMAIESLYEQYEAQKGANAGKVPVVEFGGGQATKVGKGNTSVPQLTIVKWVDRPGELSGETSQPVSAPAANATAPTPATTAPAQAAASRSEF